MSHRPRKLILNAYIFGLILGSTGLGIIYRILSSAISKEDNFTHPFFIPFFFVFGDALGILIYLYEIYRARKKYGRYKLHKKVISARTQGRATQINVLLFAFPKFLNLFAICLFGMAYSYVNKAPTKSAEIEWIESISPKFFIKKRWLARSFESDLTKPYLSFESSFVLFSSCVFILVVISKVFLGRKQYRHQWTSLLMLFIAVLMVAIPYLVDEQNSAENIFIGIALVFLAILLISIQYAFEEWLLIKYYLSPAKMTGWQGIWGILLLIIFLPIFQYIDCESRFGCKGKVEDSVFALTQMGGSALVLLLMIANIFITASYHLLGITLTKYTGANTRSVVQLLGLPFSWLFFLLIKSNSKGHQDLNFVQLVGYLLLIFPGLLYSEVVIIPWAGFGDNTREELDRKDQEPEPSLYENCEEFNTRITI